MTDAPATRTSPPWHLWVVGVLSLLWNAFGATDFVMTMLNRDAWFDMMGVTADQAAMMEAMPAWTYAAWFAGTWGAFLGSLALLLRSTATPCPTQAPRWASRA